MGRVCSQAVVVAVVAGRMCSGGCLVDWLRDCWVWEVEGEVCRD